MSTTQRSGTRAGLTGLTGVAGIVVPALGLLVLPIWEFPGTGASGPGIATWVRAHQHDLQLVMVLNTVGVTLWLAFGAEVWARLRTARAPEELVAAFGLATAGYTTLLLAGFTAFDLVVYREPRDPTMLYDLTFGLLAMSGMPTAVALGAYAAACYRTRCLPAYTAHLATATAVAHVALLASFIAGDAFFSLEGAVITVVPALLWAWILLTALALRARPAAAQPD